MVKRRNKESAKAVRKKENKIKLIAAASPLLDLKFLKNKYCIQTPLGAFGIVS